MLEGVHGGCSEGLVGVLRAAHWVLRGAQSGVRRGTWRGYEGSEGALGYS